MPDLSFQILGTESGARGLTPLLYFKLRITSTPSDEKVEAILLRTQIQFEPARRTYTAAEKETLGELFGTPDRWGQTLRNKLWAHVDISVPPFAGQVDVRLPVVCTYDLNILATKYLHALQQGDVSLLFLFSGTVFHTSETGRLQVHQVSWEKECQHTMPVQAWQELMEQCYPRSAWITLHRDVFDRVYAYKRRHGLASWEDALDRLLATKDAKEEVGV
ncbi:MAG: hypothetical protein JWM35_1438 [Verrucomicrobia bacterium]|nr:hypothetical protein [Verrucomicrobiota bacterium]